MVCYDLGKTYPEVRNLHYAEVLFHFENAMKRKNESIIDKNNTLEFIMQVCNPEMYKEYIKQKNSELNAYRITSYKENMSEEDFLNIVNQVEKRYKFVPPVKGDEIDPLANFTQAPQVNKQPQQPAPPPQWGRPAHLGPIKFIDGNSGNAPQDSTDNPVSFTKQE